ncbi:glycosyltransferase family 4 protein [Proteocatella sphenisci]|uniref:glycosyltransferase family 4 protein n=1 Tax=Proteocatella sphenisci TaxID=181070 RepID=UPI00048B2359|nr:glycosyltransferase family 4 protein [Proteocatella sphenisci]
MKIVHVCLAGIGVTDGWAYQENLLTKYHKRLGHEVTIITSQWVRDDKGGLRIDNRSEYYDVNGCKMLRLAIKNNHKQSFRFKRYQGVYHTISEESPDILFLHNIQFLDIFKIIKYIKKNPITKLYIDSHTDFSNSASNWISNNVLHGVIWRFCAKSIEPYTRKFYGVLPARVDFLNSVYRLPTEKIELLVMGADDEKVSEALDDKVNIKIRNRFSIEEDDFLIVTGGKIDLAKKQTILLMQAIKEIKNPKVKLLVFGSIVDELKDKVTQLSDGEKIQYIGWANEKQSYELFASADLVVFPGRHSVYWELVAGLGKPMIVKYWEGTTHIDIGGNCEFLYDENVEEIRNKINYLFENKNALDKMKEVASSFGREKFSYYNISKESLK